VATNNALNITTSGIPVYDGAGSFSAETTTQYDVLVGDTNNGIANVAPSATSGVPLISQGSSANPAFGTAVVAGGGTGVTTNTAYAVLCGGTTATGAIQSLAGLGSSGDVLTSNGAGALPTFQTAAGGGGVGTNMLFTATNIWFSLRPSNQTTYSVTDDRLELIPICISNQITLSKVGVYITSAVAGSSARMGLYTQDPSDGSFALVTDWGTVGTTAGSTMASVTATDVLTPTTNYWLAFVCDENGGAVACSGFSTLASKNIFSTASSNLLSSIYKDAVGIGALSASYNWSDFTLQAGASVQLYIQGLHT